MGGGMKSAAERIGEKLTQAMESQGLSFDQLANLTGKRVDHLEAVLAGFPNSESGTTMLDTVDDIAASLGLELTLTTR
jgi:hypothetical protein